jgi:DNA-binding NtrC family response regulator
MARVLVVDDEANLCAAIVGLLRARGFEAQPAESGEAALDRYASFQPDVVVLDVILPGMSGLETFSELRRRDPAVMCVFVTAHGSVPAAVEAIRAGGYDYLTKPFDNDHLVLTVERALERRGLAARVAELEQDLSARSEFAGILGRSPAILEVLRRLAKVAPSDATVLLTGESGTGKELAAKSLHRASRRSGGPFIAINCGAIPPTLAESELFGHERGSFTDAKSQRQGWFEQAQRGTLFLDEVGELTRELQVKLLRAIQEREIYRVGADAPVRIDVRLVAATNRDLTAEVSEGRFREDLYWRLNGFPIEMPALRDRPEDVGVLISHLLDRINTKLHTSALSLAPDALAVLTGYRWPGNVRELENVLQNAVIMTDGPTIHVDDLPDYLTARPSGRGAAETQETLEHAKAVRERQLIEVTLKRFGNDRTATAAALGIDRRTLYNKLRQYRRDDSDSDKQC